MEIPLPQQVPVTQTVTTQTKRNTAIIEFAYADFTAGRVSLKIQPWNKEIIIQGEAYEAMREQFEAGLAAAFAPAINEYLASLLPPPQE